MVMSRSHGRDSKKSTQTLMRLKKKFVNSTLDPKTDPEEWIIDLEDLRAQIISWTKRSFTCTS